VIERRQRLGWIVFTDSMDPDGDTVAVEASRGNSCTGMRYGQKPIDRGLSSDGFVAVRAGRGSQTLRL
jgi:hypothetical protein